MEWAQQEGILVVARETIKNFVRHLKQQESEGRIKCSDGKVKMILAALTYRLVHCEGMDKNVIPKWRGKTPVRPHTAYTDEEIKAIK